jgi:hypothetical protein
VYVDGFYIGVPADLDNELELEAGPHKIEVRGSGLEPLQFDVNILAGRSITYKGSLPAADTAKPNEPTAAPAAFPPPAPMTYYSIPGCYLGNVPPEEAKLPASCDASRAITIKQ